MPPEATVLDWRPRARPYPADPAAAAADRQRRIALARDIVGQMRPAAGTVVERYIRARGITLPISPAIGYLPPGDRYAWHAPSGERRPVMVAAVHHAEHGLVAVHRTWLAIDGSGKATLNPERMTHGPIGGAGVHLGELRPNKPLVIAGGIESALSATELLDAPAWAALSAIGIERLVLPADARDIVIAIDRDRDGFGERAARRAAARWAGEGRRVRLVIPDRVGSDPNDLLREARRAA
jgi:putative DNA primase/helicase